MSRIGADSTDNECHQGSPFGCPASNFNITFDGVGVDRDPVRGGSDRRLCAKTFQGQCGGFCPWDCGNHNNEVDTVDFLTLIGQWGQAGVSCDFGLGTVGVDTSDFLALLGHWGPCP